VRLGDRPAAATYLCRGDDATPLEPIDLFALALGCGRVSLDAVDPRDDAIPITDKDRLAALHGPEIVAQAVLQLRDLERSSPWRCSQGP